MVTFWMDLELRFWTLTKAKASSQLIFSESLIWSVSLAIVICQIFRNPPQTKKHQNNTVKWKLGTDQTHFDCKHNRNGIQFTVVPYDSTNSMYLRYKNWEM